MGGFARTLILIHSGCAFTGNFEKNAGMIRSRNNMYPFIQVTSDSSEIALDIQKALTTITKPDLTVEQVLKSQGSNPEILLQRKPDLANLTQQAIQNILRLAEPELFIAVKEIEKKDHRFIFLSESVRLQGKTIERTLRQADGIVAVIGTIGAQADECIRKTFKEDPVLALTMDTSASCLVDRLGTAVCQAAEQVMQKNGLKTALPVSPGAPDWDVAVGQPQLFSLFSSIPLSVSINSSGMMSPQKSISMFIPYGNKLDQTGKACDFCAMSNNCTFKQRT